MNSKKEYLFKARYTNVLIVAIGVLIIVSLIAFLKFHTFKHPFYLVIVIITFIYSIGPFFRKRVYCIRLDSIHKVVRFLTYNRMIKEEHIINLNDMQIERKVKMGSKGGKYTRLIISFGSHSYKITGESDGWKENEVVKIYEILNNLKDSENIPYEHNNTSNNKKVF